MANRGMPHPTGKVYLVGAGPGDPALITLRALECLRSADVVLYDYLASPHVLSLTGGHAELVCLGRHGHGRLMSQAEINEAMVRHARAGRAVVRLKGGDPTIFARAGEEQAALESAGVPYEIVPGITAAQAASSHAGIPLTDRDEASCVALITGQESSEKQPGARPLDYDALARFPGTLVFYMGVTTAVRWSRALIDHGKPATTPAAIVRRCSLPDQETVYTTLGELPGIVRSKRLRPPAVAIVGEVASARRAASWFTSRPLFGRTVLVTRPKHQADGLSNQLRNLGANVLVQPAIEIAEPADWSAADAVTASLSNFHWLVFSSSNGVDYFLQRLFASGRDARSLGSAAIAAIGPSTVEALARYHLKVDLQPADHYRAESLAEALAPHVQGKRVFLARASRGRNVLAEMLATAGAVVEQAVVYESRDVPAPDEEVVQALAGGRVDWITVTSSAIARSLLRLFGDALHNARLVAISPLTAETLSQLGHPAAAVAQVYTVAGIVDAILAAERDKG
jgi:uroporphyrinogen III methyltransferase/synthase